MHLAHSPAAATYRACLQVSSDSTEYRPYRTVQAPGRLGDCWATARDKRVREASAACCIKRKTAHPIPPVRLAAWTGPHARSTYMRRAPVAAGPEVQVDSFEGSFAVHTVPEVLLLLLTCGLVLAPLLS